MDKNKLFDELTPTIRGIIDSDDGLAPKMQKICEVLSDKIDYYDWVGFYIMEEGMLHLGPYVGEATDHDVIEVGQGICGQAANLKATFISDDVTKEDNYLSCSINVKSEIVVPIINGSNVFGEIDIDSHTAAAFSEEDKIFLEWLAMAISEIL